MEEFLLLTKIADEAELYQNMKDFLHKALETLKS